MNTPEMRLRSILGRKRIFFGVFRARETCLVAANVVHSPAAGANGAPPNLLTGFEGPHEAEKERGKGRKGG